MILTTVSIGSGNRPYVHISSVEDNCHASMTIKAITPSQLRKMADELEAEITKAARIARIEAALDAEARLAEAV